MAERLTRREALGSLGATVVLFAGAPVRIVIASDGTVTAYTGKVELGQGSQTELAMAVAEEMRVPLAKVRLVMGDTDLCPDDGGTYGSLTTPQALPVMRKAAAAQRGGELTPPGEWKVLGTGVADLRGTAIVTGKQVFPGDARVDGMLHARVVRPRLYGAKLVSVAQAEGVRLVRDGGLAAFVSSDPVEPKRAAASAKAEWEAVPFPTDPSDAKTLAQYFKANSTPPVENMNTRYPPLIRRGDARVALEATALKHTSSYWLPYLAHTPMEPRAAVAEWKDGRVTIRTGTQTPFPVRQEVARALGLDESKVRIISLTPGGAFGGKQRGEVEIEAARISRAAGAPVRVQWSREEEFTCSYHRPAGLMEVESAVDTDGKLTAWIHRNYNSGAAGLQIAYAIPHYSCEFHRSPSPVRQGSYRSLAAAANTFARECHVDEWAARLKADPLEFRIRNCGDERLRTVLERLGKGPGGIACTLEKDARIALRAEVEVRGREIRLKRFTFVGDYGAVVNQVNLRKQIQGALVMGIGGALLERVEFDRNSQKTRRLSMYRVPRFGDVPEIRLELIDRREVEPAGAGESAITLVAPAVANAIFAATGKRLRSLPFSLSEL
ncbi:MAG: xanthine dehydrogenase family protein molybdopterin-binding subunit [Acidobacteria bacterium]|nr:xanthine dehydrogenase family protein molybdopterin-binding subunit [Acidobacteriota bacterium]